MRHDKVHGLLFEKKKKRLACTTWNECKLNPDEEVVRRGAGRPPSPSSVRAEKQKTKKEEEEEEE